MKQCPACAFNNPDTRDRCLRCSTALGAVSLPTMDEEVIEARPSVVGERLGALQRALHVIGDAIEKRSEPPHDAAYRSPFRSAVLSLVVPGGGQFHTYQTYKGAFFAVGWVALMAVVVARFFETDANAWLLGWWCWAALSAADAYQMALRINGRPTTPRYVLGYFFAFVFITGMALFASQWVLFLFGVRLVHIWGDDLTPAVHDGDRYLVVNWPILFGQLPPDGSILYFSRAALRAEGVGGNTISARQLRTLGVVCGQPGDVIAWVDRGRPRLNGTPFPDALMPIRPSGLTKDFEMRVPPDRVAALLSNGTSEMLAGKTPSPAELENRGWIILPESLHAASTASPREMLGVAILRYHPPPRRAWLGFRNGFWGRDGLPPAERRRDDPAPR